MTFLKSIVVTFSFFSTIPMPFINWEQKYFRYVPFILPFVGVVIGLGGYVLVELLSLIEVSSFLKAVVICLYFIMITGGLHLDAVMDTCDAHFSRRDIDRKHEIMKDSRVGAFAVVGFFVLMMFKISVVYDLVRFENFKYYIIFIPIISRTYQAIMLYVCPYALEEGIASLYKGVIKQYDLIIFAVYITMITLIGYFLGIKLIILVIVGFVMMIWYRRFAIKQFRGITGDIIGAFLEITEVILLTSILFI